MNLLAIAPLWARLAALAAFAAALLGFGWVKGAHHVQGRWDAATVALERAQSKAITDRLASNARLADKQAADNRTITEGKDNEIAALTARINAAPRMRVGPALCGRSPAPAQAPSTGSGDGTNSPSGVVRPDVGRDLDAPVARADVDRDIRTLKLAVEKDLATGRACQAFARKNGFAQ